MFRVGETRNLETSLSLPGELAMPGGLTGSLLGEVFCLQVDC